MKIFGHEYTFTYSVGADEEIKNLSKENPEMSKVEINARVAMIMSDWHERAESLRAQAEGREYIPAPLEMETINLLTFTEFEALVNECDAVIKRDTGRTVETEDAETEKKTKAAEAS